jgi:hypothetical protein
VELPWYGERTIIQQKSNKVGRELWSMGTPDTVESVVIVVGILLFVAILFGPSLFGTFQNWKMRKGLKR